MKVTENNHKYKAVIIGCGNIAGGYDSLQDKNVLTHAHAISIHKKTDLVGVYDLFYKKAVTFARKWKTVPFIGLKEMFSQIKPDLVYICTPTETHVKVLKVVLDYKPKAVICEKPLSNDSRLAKKVLMEYKKNKISLTVNFNRRFDSTIQKIKYNIDNGRYGSFINTSVIYTKGILNNGSHVIDLLRYFFGEVISYKILAKTIDYKKTDPTLDIFLKFKNNIKVHLIAGNAKEYSIGEMDLLFSKIRINIYQFGLQYSLQAVRQDPIFSDYKDLGERVIKQTNINEGLLKLIDNIIGHVEKKEKLLSCGENALKTQEICMKLIKEAK
ncbi:hypothetical protein COT75_02990 [Candidatus Beckwithbacteria bacterium CG10_big_fil_rev_8_21_14_0_10_34_10]|uniref:Gfo/Idh/MocA-like oxidoreductase N-terminal domain-containing protein n=1 Tax=Candidatus Beckwithbacteria bacterium CG10_big_fil_rev_8_21_14_0_10_34_10 TaxID=1974495 RepID=A0A2H0W967_9BACT|nr:MAG: hypothetical protein COT75_02990 [Candidatus Beckwithbacteria bacterium CG10_big_fil_rev_8_21_14_0_10_34_10]